MRRTTVALLVLLALSIAPGLSFGDDTPSSAERLLAFISDPANADKTYGDLRKEALSLGDVGLQAGTAAAVLEDAAAVAAAAPGTMGAPDGFASRVNESLTNFLPLLGFAVNTVSTGEDSKSVSVIYNPIRLGRRGVVSFSTTFAEPEVSDQLIGQVEQSAQAAQRETITGSIGDFSDIAASVTYGYQRSDEGSNWGHGHYLWGRNPKLYQNLANELMGSVWQETFGAVPVGVILDTSDFEEALFDNIPGLGRQVDNATFKQIREAFGSDALKAVMPRVVAEGKARAKFYAALEELDLRHFAAMVANQPQLTFTGAYRYRDDFVGGDETVFTAKVEIGAANLNRAMTRYKKRHAADPSYTKLKAYKWAIKQLKVQAQNRAFFSATYKARAAWDPSYAYTLEIPDPMGGAPMQVPRIASLNVAKGRDVCIKAGWSRTFKRSGSTLKSRGLLQTLAKAGEDFDVPELAALADAKLDVPARIDLSIEYIDVDGDDPLMQDRGIARFSYALPLPGGLSLPFTLTYANHSKFLGEQDDDLTAHIGLSYTLPGK